MKSAKVLFNVAAFICYVFGAVYFFTLVFIPIGVYCFIAAKTFAYKADHLNENYAVSDKLLKNYTIFASVACFPLGLISIIPYLNITSNNVKVSEPEGFKITLSEIDADFKPEIETSEIEALDNNAEAKVETEEEKQEKLKKLENFRDKGIITEEELQMAREQLFGKKDN